jgi:Flp pilus assembly protein CpaB
VVTTRAARRQLAARMSTGHVVMVLAGLLGVVLTLSVLRTDAGGRPVVVAASDLVPGTVINRDAIRVERVDASAAVLASTFGADEIAQLQGHVATASMRRGQLLTRESVSAADAGAATRSMSFPLPEAHALGGALDAGDHVDVLAVQHDGGRAGYVMTDARVLAVDGAHRGPLATTHDVTVTLAVDTNAAVRLAAALEGGTVTLVRATGAASVADAPTYEGGDARPSTVATDEADAPGGEAPPHG